VGERYNRYGTTLLLGSQQHLERALALARNLPIGIARVSPAGFTGGFAMKNAWAIVLQVKEFFYRLKQISTPLGIA
jgi:hypothetical protein